MSTLLRACADHVYKYGLLVTSILGSLAFGLVRSARTHQRWRRNDTSNPFGLLLKETTASQTKLHGISNQQEAQASYTVLLSLSTESVCCTWSAADLYSIPFPCLLICSKEKQKQEQELMLVQQALIVIANSSFMRFISRLRAASRCWRRWVWKDLKYQNIGDDTPQQSQEVGSSGDEHDFS